MTPQEFVSNAIKTESDCREINIQGISLVCALGIAALSANIVDAVKKKIFYGKDFDKEKVAYEIYDLQEVLSIMKKQFESGLVEEASEEFRARMAELNVRLLHAAMGMFTEAGELMAPLMEQLSGNGLDVINFGEEIGDSLWYAAIASDELGIALEKIMQTVIEKLAKRYPEKFSAEAAINRDTDAERKILEDRLMDAA